MLEKYNTSPESNNAPVKWKFCAKRRDRRKFMLDGRCQGDLHEILTQTCYNIDDNDHLV